MPKIVENVKERIILETKKQIEEMGYSKVTIRSIAKACGIGVGTIYNYFESKDVIIANFMLDDWILCVNEIKEKISSGSDSIKSCYLGLEEYIKHHQYLFSNSDAYKNYKTISSKWHLMLRNQIAEILDLSDAFLSEFIAEAIITWAVQGKNYDELKPIFERLINN